MGWKNTNLDESLSTVIDQVLIATSMTKKVQKLAQIIQNLKIRKSRMICKSILRLKANVGMKNLKFFQ